MKRNHLKEVQDSTPLIKDEDYEDMEEDSSNSDNGKRVKKTQKIIILWMMIIINIIFRISMI